MKRWMEWAFWAVGVVAMAYLALYLYASVSGHPFQLTSGTGCLSFTCVAHNGTYVEVSGS